MYRIYIAEDDESIAAAIARGLSAWDFEVRTASDFKRIADEIAEYDPHLVLLDITLPFYNGFYWCSELRRNSRVPVVFISSAADNMNIVMAMNMGGDDFIAKPFDMSVLTAKIQALLRRISRSRSELSSTTAQSSIPPRRRCMSVRTALS